MKQGLKGARIVHLGHEEGCSIGPQNSIRFWTYLLLARTSGGGIDSQAEFVFLPHDTNWDGHQGWQHLRETLPVWKIRVQEAFEKFAVIGHFEVEQFVDDGEFLKPAWLSEEFDVE